jgi:superfamily II helicase
LDIANSITAFGRDTIKKTKEYIEERYKYRVVYGDTDSVMVKVPFEDLEDMRKAGEEVAKNVTSVLKGVMEEVAPEHDEEGSSEEYVANAVVCNGKEVELERINTMMVGTMEPVLPELIRHRLVKRIGKGTIELSPLAHVMADAENLPVARKLLGQAERCFCDGFQIFQTVSPVREA